jgi:hypothetical protein
MWDSYNLTSTRMAERFLETRKKSIFAKKERNWNPNTLLVGR